MKLTIIGSGNFSRDWPEISVVVNNRTIDTFTIKDYSEVHCEVDLSNNSNQIEFHYINKTEDHTEVVNNIVINDQFVEIKKIRFDDILCESWMLTEGYYLPTYFDGFLNKFPNSPEKLKSQLIWHFPGKFLLPILPNENNIWEWYSKQRYIFHKQNFNEKSKMRDEGYVGTSKLHHDLLNEIKDIINAKI